MERSAQENRVAVSAVQGQGVKRCRICRRPFAPRNTLQQCCSPSCAVTYARLGGEKRQSAAMKRCAAAAAREAKQEVREKKKAIISLSKLKNLAQREVNRYIRERDAALGCISCHMPASYQGQWTAGHYRTRKAAPQLRFHEDNLAKQCGQCNYHKSGNIPDFRLGLIRRIGVERVEAIENNHETKKWTREELIEIRRAYLAKWKALVASRGSV